MAKVGDGDGGADEPDLSSAMTPALGHDATWCGAWGKQGTVGVKGQSRKRQDLGSSGNIVASPPPQ